MLLYFLMTMALLFFGTLVVLLFRFYFTDRRRMTSITEGRVVSAQEQVSIEKDLRKVRTEVVAAYTARGQEYQVKRVIDGSKAKIFPPGRPVTVRYNPGEPDMSELAL